ncbi:MAG: M48 family metalloprotease [Spirochaetes bacterium]|jgi:predicted Zn-dependent protease|nr:M48 family metalloprotease [Spirochaetota bacterium]
MRKYIISVILLTLLFSCSGGENVRKSEAKQKEQVMQELLYGRLLSRKILSRYKVYDNQEATIYVTKVGRSVALFAGRSELTYYFSILDSDSINAFAAPGGYIFITLGSLKSMKNEAELAAILSHEIGHVNNRHIMRQIPPPRNQNFADTIAAVLVAQGTVVSSAMNETVNRASKLLFEDGYKIEDEYEADRSAVTYLIQTGYEHTALTEFMKRIDIIKSENSSIEVYHTHPPTNDRVSKINEYIIAQNATSINGKLVEKRFQNFIRTIN